MRSGSPEPGGSQRGANLLPCDGTVRYHETFFAPALADELFGRCCAELSWARESARFFGRSVPLPRLTAWYGPTAYAYSGVEHPAAAFPPLLGEVAAALGDLAPGADSVLANRYRDGRDSVAFHADDEDLWGLDPLIASVSFGAARRFVLRHRASGERLALELGHGSLLLMAGATQRAWLHAVPKTARPVGERVNLTFRRLVQRPAGRSAGRLSGAAAVARCED